MTYDISVGSLTLRGIEAVSVESSVDHLADTCIITVPGQVRGQAYRVEDRLKRGDAVTVKLGYGGKNEVEFTGYLLRISPNSPMKLECEDSIFLFRKPVKDKQFKKTSAIDVARYVLDQINAQLSPADQMTLVANATGFQYDKFTIVHATGYEVLDRLKSDMGLTIYCRDQALHVHASYTQKTGDVTYDFTRNVEASDDLQYVRADQLLMQAKVIGRSKKGEKIEVTVGSTGGDLRTINLPNVSDKNTLMLRGKEELKRLSYDGYKGSIHAWLIPLCGIGYTAKVVDKDYPEREGSYYVKGMKVEFSASGGRRVVELGIKVS